MDDVIGRISEIEAAAVLVMDEAYEKKKKLSEDMNEQIAIFDNQAVEETEKTLIKLQTSMNEDMKVEIEKLQCKKDMILKELEDDYKQNHFVYAQQILDHLLKG